MAFKFTYTPSDEILTNVKERGIYPFPYGGFTWEVGQSRTLSDPSPMVDMPKYPKYKGEWVFREEFTVEIITEEPHGDTPEE